MDFQQWDSFKIIAQINPVNSCLDLPPTMHIYSIFYVSMLEPYKKSQIPSRIPPPPQTNHNVECEVAEILDSRLRHRHLEYFIHCKGYGITEHTWEPSSNCQNVLDKI